MSSETWAKIGQYSAVIGALGGVVGSIGGAAGGTVGGTLSDIGSITAEIGRLGTQVSATGAFAEASTEQQAAALTNASPILGALNVQTQDARRQAAAAEEQRDLAAAQRVQAGTTGTSSGGNPIADIIRAVLEIPLKIVRSITGG